jgi:hypothetical protein
MIKNGKKHFGRDLEKEQLVNSLRDFLVNMTDNLGNMPSTYDSSTIFNKMIEDMLKMKFN